jgi:hypothetical protein
MAASPSDYSLTVPEQYVERFKYAIGEPPPVVMAEMGHTDPALALSIYAHAMRRDEGESERLRALVEGPSASLGGFEVSETTEGLQDVAHKADRAGR